MSAVTLWGMASRMFLHVGTMKSATTYIQRLLEANRDRLLEEGLLWPTADTRYQAVRELLGQRKSRGRRNAWRTLLREINSHQGDAVFSNELLAAFDVEQIRRLVQAFPPEMEIHVVITARDLVRVIPSHWQSKMKDGRTETWSEFAASVCADPEPRGPAAVETETLHDWFWRRHDVASIISRWSKSVPMERISLVTVPSTAGDPNAVARRFGTVVGVDLTGLTQPQSLNASLGAHSAELLRRLNEVINAAEVEGRRYGPKVALAPALIERAAEEPRFALAPAHHAWVVERAKRMVDEIAKTGARVEGDLDELIPSAEPALEVVDPAAASDGELLQAASHGLIAMVSVVGTMREDFQALLLQLQRLEAECDRDRRRLNAERARNRRLRASSAPAVPAPAPTLSRRTGRRIGGFGAVLQKAVQGMRR